MEEDVLGVGSRVKHPSLGVAVVIHVHANMYDICFLNTVLNQLIKESTWM